jgi:hypothetical protein
LGNSNITTVQTSGVFNTLSDARDKTDVEPLESVGPLIDQLRPVRFTWDMRNGGEAKKGRPEIGLLAQEVLEAQDSAGIYVPNLVNESNPETLLVSYTSLIPLLVKAIQELREEVALLHRERL